MSTPDLFSRITARLDRIEAIAARSLPWDRAALKRLAGELRAEAMEARACERMIDELVEQARAEELETRAQLAARHASANVIPLRPRARPSNSTPPNAA